MKEKNSSPDVLYIIEITMFRVFLKKSFKIVSKKKLCFKIQNKSMNIVFAFME